MSGFSLWDADDDTQNAPNRQARTASLKLESAIKEVRAHYGSFLLGATGKDEFEDRWHYSKADIRKTVNGHIPPVTGIMRRVHDALKRDFKATLEDDPSDAGHLDTRETFRPAKGALIPEGDFDRYLSEVDQGAHEKAEHNFGEGGDSGAHPREAMKMTADLYADWAQSNGMRVASLDTLAGYDAVSSLSGREHALLAHLIQRKAECECDEDEEDDVDSDGPEGPDGDSDGPPPFASEGDDEEDEDEGSDEDADDSDEGGDDDEPTFEEEFGDDEPTEDDGGDEGGPMEAPAGPPSLDEEGGPAGPGEQFSIPDVPPELSPESQGAIPEDDTDGGAAIPPQVIDEILGLPRGTVEQLVMEELSGGSEPAPGGPPSQMMARRYQAGGFGKARGSQRRAAEDPTQGADPAAGGQAVAPEGAPDPAVDPSTPGNPGGVDASALLEQAEQAVGGMVQQKTQEFQSIIDPLQQALQALDFVKQVEEAKTPLDVTPPEGTVDVGPQAATPPPEAPPAAPAQAPAPAAPQDPNAQQQLAKRAFRLAKNFGLSQSGYNSVLAAMEDRRYMPIVEAVQGLPMQRRTAVAASLADLFSAGNPRFNPDNFLRAAGVEEDYEQEDREAEEELRRRHKERGGEGNPDPRDFHKASRGRRPFVRSASPQGGERIAGETWKNMPVADSFEFPNQGAPESSDNMKVNDLPKVKTKTPKIGSGIVEEYQKDQKRREEKGISFGGDTDVEGFLQNRKKVGPRAVKKLHQEVGIAPHEKTGSFFQKKVAGWAWDDHLNAYVTAKRKPFTCTTSGCGNSIPTPSYGTCHCGKIWNTYAIGSNAHLASGDAEMYLAREIPVREGVIMASRKMAQCDYCGAEGHDWTVHPEAHADVKAWEHEKAGLEEPFGRHVESGYRHAAEEYNNASGDGPCQDYPEDIEFFEDDELADAPMPHAPGETEVGGSRTAKAKDAGDGGYEDERGICAECLAPYATDPEDGSYRHADGEGYDDPSFRPHDEDNDHYPVPREARTAASIGDDDHNVVNRDGEKFCSQCDAMLWDPNVHHCPIKQSSRDFFADWTVFDDVSNAGYENGPDGPPSTGAGNIAKDWARRGPEKGPAGQWAKPTFKTK